MDKDLEADFLANVVLNTAVGFERWQGDHEILLANREQLNFMLYSDGATAWLNWLCFGCIFDSCMVAYSRPELGKPLHSGGWQVIAGWDVGIWS